MSDEHRLVADIRPRLNGFSKRLSSDNVGVSLIETEFPEMKNYLVLFLTLTLIACGPSQDEKESVAAVTCSVMGETRNMDGAIRIREMNAAREKIGGEPFLRGDDVIQEAFEYGLCEELVLGGVIYDESKRIKDSKPTVEEWFHRNGELGGRINYQSKSEGEKRHGLSRTWYDNGQLWRETSYKDGKKHGVERRWHDNGQLWEKTTYKDGVEHGLARQGHENGYLTAEYCYSNGVKVDMRNCQG